ncbi:WUSCHEL-related homeobox 9 [Diospyros lotus]|uniref:WUSCHEL-related homeobox 9 n=1 Tax=Diospyros lotus TaxID=55363 RepID=UPI00224E480A|nr:WUSCHEL-related homeobox 9 [Diospyros lotus]
MASSNRHWPSMFKSKPCSSSHHHQWQHDINPSLLSTACHRPPFTSSAAPGCEERSPEPKPRWNPKPEQIRILEAIFNSGMVNPPRDEIRKIRAQLQEFGQVGDANVFYWFQNRKSRSKHKQRHLQNSKQPPQQNFPSSAGATASVTTPSSSSSSSEKSSPKSLDKTFSVGSASVIEISNSPTVSVNQTYFQAPTEFLPEPFFFPMQQTPGAATAPIFTQGFCFPELPNAVQVPADQSSGSYSSLLLGELMMGHGPTKIEDNHQKLKLQQQMYSPPTAPSTISHILGESGSMGPAKSTVFINDVAFEVAAGPFNVRETFGDDAMLIQPSGQPVATTDWGVTLHPLQHGGFYYLVRTLTPITASSSETRLI